MKKLLFLLLTLTIVLCLASCEWFETKPDDNHEHTWEYVQYETGHFKQFTCGCPSPDIMGEHENWDADLLCDICGYDMTTSLTPTNHFLRNQAGCEWLNEITAEDIAEIKMFSSGGGPLPPVNLINVSSSTDKAVISYIFEQYYWLDITPIDVPPVICDGGNYTVQFVLSNGAVKQFSFLIGEYFTDANGNCFEILNLPEFREDDNYTNYYTIEAIDDYGDVYAINSGEPQYIGVMFIEELQFIVMCDDIELGASEPTHYIELRGEIINFIGEDYFYFNDNREVYYQLIGKNLDELIAEYINLNE